jgi:hypothetical protein
LDLVLFGSNKGYCSCSPCHHFHRSTFAWLYVVCAFLHHRKIIFYYKNAPCC